MTFDEISNIKKEDISSNILEEAARFGETVSQELLDSLFDKHILNLKRTQLHIEVSQLIDNNCATLLAFPEASENYKAWITSNILENPEVDTAITYLKRIQDAENVLNEEYNSNKYKEKRKSEYPDVMDYIDAQVKKANPSTLMEGMMQEAEYFEKCLAVKAKYPKGTK